MKDDCKLTRTNGSEIRYTVSIPKRLKGKGLMQTEIVLRVTNGEYQYHIFDDLDTSFTSDELEAIAKELKRLNNAH